MDSLAEYFASIMVRKLKSNNVAEYVRALQLYCEALKISTHFSKMVDDFVATYNSTPNNDSIDRNKFYTMICSRILPKRYLQKYEKNIKAMATKFINEYVDHAQRICVMNAEDIIANNIDDIKLRPDFNKLLNAYINNFSKSIIKPVNEDSALQIMTDRARCAEKRILELENIISELNNKILQLEAQPQVREDNTVDLFSIIDN